MDYPKSLFYQDSLKNTLIAKNTKLPYILDMCYLSGKIYEDPEKDTGLTCSLPEGAEIFKNCSDLNANWEEFEKEHENDGIKAAFNSIKYAAKWIIDNSAKANLNNVFPRMTSFNAEARSQHSDLQKLLENEIKKDESYVNEIAKISKSSTGFKAALYISAFYNCSILVFRGTEQNDPMTFITDLLYTANIVPEMYKQAIHFYNYVLCLPFIKYYPLIACTGHSLGGIIAKMIAPVTGLSTYTFNSPGVLQILRENNFPIGLRLGQEVLTFIAEADPVGHLRWDNDFGGKEEDHIFLPVFDGKRIVAGSIFYHDNVLFEGININYLNNFIKNKFIYHGIVDMFYFLKTAKDACIYRTRAIKFNANN